MFRTSLVFFVILTCVTSFVVACQRSSIVHGDESAAAAVDQFADPLTGTWRIVSSTIDGKAAEEAIGTEVRFTDGRVESDVGEPVDDEDLENELGLEFGFDEISTEDEEEVERPDETVFYRLRPGEKLGEIDLLMNNEDGEQELAARGIYRIEDGQLTLCFIVDLLPFRFCGLGDLIPPRPVDFDSEGKQELEDHGKAIMKLKRIAKEE